VIAALLVVAGLAVLVVGGELVVRGASRLAIGFGISPVVIGLTVVAFGTSSPELAVSLGSTLQGSPDVAVGNVLGSNVYNILLVLGLAALVRPLVVEQQLVIVDVPLVIGASVLLWVLALDGSIGMAEGAVFVALLAGYTVLSIRAGRHEPAAIEEEYRAAVAPPGPASSRSRDVLLLVVGIGALAGGAQALVTGATSVAQALGIPELVIGLTVVAIGTSLPEVVTSLVAAIRGQRDLAVGNVIGSNLFNILGVLGVTALVAPGGVPIAAGAVSFDIPVMTVVAVACLPLLFTGHLIRRWEGALFLGYAVAYTAYLALDSTAHPTRDVFADAMTWFVIPLTLVTIAVVVLADLRRRSRPADPGGGEPTRSPP
jgi:cation:H+ antiporter